MRVAAAERGQHERREPALQRAGSNGRSSSAASRAQTRDILVVRRPSLAITLRRHRS